MARSRKNNEKGFTLIELLIVVAIIGILAAIAIPNLLTFVRYPEGSQTGSGSGESQQQENTPV